MATGKRYYWIKLKQSFMTSDAVDFLMSEQDGANYVVLYQMLCLKTINTGGKLERHIGEIIIPYDEAKIERECKWFSIDTVRVALKLYKALGLIYVDNDGVLCLTGHDELVGSETDYAAQKRRQATGDNPRSLPQSGVESGVENLHTEIEYRDRVRDREVEGKSSCSKKDSTVKRFIPPSVEDVKCYCRERGNNIDAQYFVDYYTARGWKIGKNPMKDWKAAVRTWERRDREGVGDGGGSGAAARSEQFASADAKWGISGNL